MPYLLFIFLLLIFPLQVGLAQFGGATGGSGLTINLDPAFPDPGEEFTATVNDYSLSATGAKIRWFIDGKLAPEYQNQRKINQKAKGVGAKTTIELVLDLPSGQSITASTEVRPVYLDIILEPQTRTPAFYQGRALPSYDSLVNAVALVDGEASGISNLVYTWRLNSKATDGGGVRGKNTYTFTVPRGYSSTLSVEVTRLDGTIVAKRIVDVPSIEPSLVFYEMSPLYGLVTKGLVGSFTLIGSSASLLAEPYNLDLRTYNNPDLIEWKIDNQNAVNTGANPYEITIAPTGESGQAKIDFHVRNLRQILQGSSGSILTYF